MSRSRQAFGRAGCAAPAVLALAGLALVGCAAPPATIYKLEASSAAGPSAPLGRTATVIEIARVTLPDYLDTQDILVRRGSTLETSHRGRWASRLSLGATELLTARLAQTRPDALVTNQPQTPSPTYRILINVSRFDVSAENGMTLEADWLIIPNDAAVPVLRDRVHLDAAGPVASDRDVVALETRVLLQLAAAIDITRLR